MLPPFFLRLRINLTPRRCSLAKVSAGLRGLQYSEYYHFYLRVSREPAEETLVFPKGHCCLRWPHLPYRESPITIWPMMPEARVAAPLTTDVAERVAIELYGLAAVARALPGEYDDNFHLQAADSREFVLKIMHPVREDAFVDMQCRAFTHLAARAPRLALPRVIPTNTGELYIRAPVDDESSRLVWMLSYLPGKTLAETKPHTQAMLGSLGRLLANIDLALMDFAHPCAQRFL